jgi:hypothetical protein
MNIKDSHYGNGKQTKPSVYDAHAAVKLERKDLELNILRLGECIKSAAASALSYKQPWKPASLYLKLQLSNRKLTNMDSRLLRPDPAIISAIFIESQPDSVEILAHCFTNCTFKAEFKDRPTVIVRLDTSSGSLDAVSALQEAAAFQIPTYVPETLASGKAVTADQRNVDYTVTRFISGTVPLESVWPSLDLANKTLLVDAVVKAVKKLSEFKVSEKRAQSVFSKICTVDAVGDIRIGGPRIGFAEDTRGLITLFVAQHQQASRATSSIEEASDGNGILIKSALPELGEIHLSAHDLKTLDESVVFQHNDLEPRNLLVKREESKDGLQYKLAAIIDWEMAGFFPSAFETAVKDISLGSCNQYLEWYDNKSYELQMRHTLTPYINILGTSYSKRELEP